MGYPQKLGKLTGSMLSAGVLPLEDFRLSGEEAACFWRPPLSSDFTNRDGTSI